MVYTQTEIVAALQGSGRTWEFRYERLSSAGVSLGDVNMTGVRVTHAALADQIKRTVQGVIAPATPFDYQSDRLRAHARLRMPDGGWNEWALGTFLLSTTQTARTASMPADPTPVTGYDLLQVVVEDSVTDRYIVAAATNYKTAIDTVLVGAGFPTNTVAVTSKTLPAAMEWEPGTTKLRIVNDLLSAINFTTLSMDPTGQPTAGPYVPPGDAAVLWSYSLDSASLVRPGTVTNLDLFRVPNVIVGYVSQPDRPPLRSVAVNDDPLSPLSTVRRGRSIVESLDQTTLGEVADQTTLDEKVAQRLDATSQQYETIEFSTGVMPQHDDSDVVTFDYGDGPYRYRETGWEMELRAGGVMKHTARRVVTV